MLRNICESVQREVNLEMGDMIQYLRRDIPDFKEVNDKLWESIDEDLTESNPNRSMLIVP